MKNIKGKCLLRCTPTINDISFNDKELLGEMFIVAQKIAKKLNINKSGYRVVFNCNEDGGQTVFHLHIQN